MKKWKYHLLLWWYDFTGQIGKEWLLRTYGSIELGDILALRGKKHA